MGIICYIQQEITEVSYLHKFYSLLTMVQIKWVKYKKYLVNMPREKDIILLNCGK